MNQIKNIKNKAVIDLAWLISSPPLIDSSQLYPNSQFFQKLWEDNKNWIMDLDNQPLPLLDFLTDKKTFQLGRYCENLLTFFFIHSPQYELLENNLQIYDQTSTIGEVDFLVKETDTDEIIHIELAVKFYISRNKSPSFHEFIGPNTKDRLDLKIKKINQQIKIIEKHPEVFENYGDSNSILKKIFFKGMLFYEESHLKGNRSLNEQHLRGRKIIYDSKFDLPSQSSYYFPHKLEWITAPSDATFLEYSKAIEKIKEMLKNRNAILIFEKNEHSINKFFIVNPIWPMN